jgi:hypothetical protein
MHRVAIFLRSTGNVNRFRRAILNALRTDLVDEVLVCSGFFQDDKNTLRERTSTWISRGSCSPLAKHAKRPLVGIIGSSDITRRAFGELQDFNYECDVVMWEESVQQIDAAMNAAIGDLGDISDVIVTNYDVEHRANRRPLAHRLLALEAEILAKAVDV